MIFRTIHSIERYGFPSPSCKLLDNVDDISALFAKLFKYFHSSNKSLELKFNLDDEDIFKNE